jgi:hypothetical protein
MRTIDPAAAVHDRPLSGSQNHARAVTAAQLGTYNVRMGYSKAKISANV